MPLQIIKKETPEKLSLLWVLHVKNYELTLSRNSCVGCQICSLACPKEAIKIEKQVKKLGDKGIRAKIDVDPSKCNFCGVCDITCPFGAMKVTVDGKHDLSVLEKQSFPQIVRDVRVDPAKLSTYEGDGSAACPLNLIKVHFLPASGKPTQEVDSINGPEQAILTVSVEVDKEHCPSCGICETKLPEGAARVRKPFSGKLAIHSELCPPGCTDCLDVCPITGVLYLSENEKKVKTNEMFCVYCGACKVVCPVDGALDLKRTHINHTTVHSGAWNKALERLTSPTDMTKELKAKRSMKTRESVKKRIGLKEEQHA